MVDKAAESENDDLFGGASIAGLEDYLLTVDVPEGEEVAEIVEKAAGAGGDGDPSPTTTEDPPKTASDSTVVETVEDNLITVDSPAPEKTEKTETTEPPGTATTTEAKKEETEKGTKVTTGEENLSPMYLHAAALQQDYGLLPNFDLATIKDLKPDEQMLKVNEAIQANAIEEADERFKAEMENWGDPTKKFYEDLKAGVPYGHLANNASLEERYGNITVKSLEENEEMQEAVYTDSLVMKGLSDAKVEQLIQVSKDNEALLTDSTDGLKEIQGEIKSEREAMRRNAEERSIEAKERSDKTQAKIKTTVTGTKAIIPGMELTTAEHNQIIKDMTVPVRFVNDAHGQSVPVSKVQDLRSQDPIAFEMRLNYFIQKGFFDKDARFENIAKEATTSATKILLDKINTQEPTGGTPAVKETKEKIEGQFIYPFETS